MSDIKTDVGTTRDDALRRMQEGFDKRETEIDRKHRQEIKVLKEQAQEDKTKLTQGFEDQIGHEREDNRQRLTDQEARHMKEIEDLREIYNKNRMREARLNAQHRSESDEKPS